MRGSDRLQGFVRNRWVRLGLAATLIAVSAWAFLPYVGYRIATSAFVNAELIRVAAPMAGRLTSDLPHKGEFIEHATAVKLIEVLSRDQRHLLDLVSRHTVATERADLAHRQLEEIAITVVELTKRAVTYRDGMIARLGHQRDEISAEQIGCLAEANQRRDVGSRLEQLVKSGTATPIRSAEALALLEATSARCGMATAKLQRIETELASARDSVFLGDGANDAPYSLQQRDRLSLRRQELETKALEERLLASQIVSEIAAERERIDRISRYDISLPARHVVWSVPASPGSTVSEGQTLLDLAACTDRFVMVELPEREFERIKAGAPAYIRLIGSDEWKLGQIRQVRGSAARGDDRLLAAQVQSPDPHSITVEIRLPHDIVQKDRNNFCDIGRLAEVRFQRGSFAFIENIGRALQGLVGRFVGGSSIAAASG